MSYIIKVFNKQYTAIPHFKKPNSPKKIHKIKIFRFLVNLRK